MSSCFNPIGETGITICRDGDEYGSPVRLKVRGAYDPAATSYPLTTQDIGKLAASLSLIYFRRTGKVPMPPASTPFATVEFHADEPAKEAGCAFCLDECTGDCL